MPSSGTIASPRAESAASPVARLRTSGSAAYVDRIYAVDDASPDGSWSVIQRVADQLNEEATPEPAVALTDGGDDRRVVPIQHDENRGYGAAVKTGYKRAAEDGIDVVAVLNGDGQMDPEIMDRIIDPVVTAVRILCWQTCHRLSYL